MENQIEWVPAPKEFMPMLPNLSEAYSAELGDGFRVVAGITNLEGISVCIALFIFKSAEGDLSLGHEIYEGVTWEQAKPLIQKFWDNQKEFAVPAMIRINEKRKAELSA